MRRLLLCSGGLDSSAVALLYSPEALLFVDYGQKARGREWKAVCHLSKLIHRPLIVRRVRPDYPCSHGYLPARNLLLLSVAIPAAERFGFGEIWFGFTKGEVYGDATAEWIDKANELLQTEGLRVKVVAPAVTLSDSELIIKACEQFGVRWLLKTYSCMSAPACGVCVKCHRRETFINHLIVELKEGLK